jgi:glycosyltransferase involved in cell wall biosynthesis
VLVTVAICTWNRAKSLRRTLEGFTHLSRPEGVQWELLIVNNNSTDETDNVVDSFIDRLPIRRCLEYESGLSAARNRAISEARGDYILWTDDDVQVGKEWLEAYCHSFLRFPEASFFSGRIDLLFLETPPAWLMQTLHIDGVASSFAALDLGAEPRELKSEFEVFGANMAFRTSAQMQYPYDLGLGRSATRSGRSILSGEETRVVSSMLQAGLRGRWVPDAQVEHCIGRERMTLQWVRAAVFAYGVYIGRESPDRDDETLRVGKARSWLKAIRKEARYRLRRVVSDPETWIPDMLEASRYRGQIRGSKERRNKSGPVDTGVRT